MKCIRIMRFLLLITSIITICAHALIIFRKNYVYSVKKGMKRDGFKQ